MQGSTLPPSLWTMVTPKQPSSMAGSPIQADSARSVAMDDLVPEVHDRGGITHRGVRSPRAIGEGIEPARQQDSAPQGNARNPKPPKKMYKKHPEGKLDRRLSCLNEEFQFNTEMTTFTSIDLPRGVPCSPRTSEPVASHRLPGVPTASGARDPGAYHQANAMLRRQLPHYKVRSRLALLLSEYAQGTWSCVGCDVLPPRLSATTFVCAI